MIIGVTVQKEVVQRLRVEKNQEAEEEERWIRELKAYLKGNWNNMSMDSSILCRKISGVYEISEEGLLIYCPNSRSDGEDRNMMVRLVVPETLQTDFLHHYHPILDRAT